MRRSLGAKKKRASASQDTPSASSASRCPAASAGIACTPPSTSLPTTPHNGTIDSFFPKQTAPTRIAAPLAVSQPAGDSQAAFHRLRLFASAVASSNLPSLNPFALRRADEPSATAASPRHSSSSQSEQLSVPTRSSSKPRCPLFPLNVASREKRKRKLSSQLPASLHTALSVRLSKGEGEALPDESELTDNSAFCFPAPVTATTSFTSSSVSSSTRNSLPEAPRKRKTASRRGGSEGGSTAEADAAAAIVDSVASHAGSASAFLSSSLQPLSARNGVTVRDEKEEEPAGRCGLRLAFASQGSDETAAVAEEEEHGGIVYDTSQEEEKTVMEEEDEQPTQQLPAPPDLTARATAPPPPPAALPAQAAAAPSRSFSSLSITRRPSNGFMLPAYPPPAAAGRPLGRSSSIASAASSQSQSQGSDYCTPLDQPVKPRTDEQRTLDMLNARQRQRLGSAQPALLPGSTAAASHLQPGSAPALPAVSINTFLPFSQRHSVPPRPAAALSSAAACSSSRLLSDFAVLRTVGSGTFGSVLQCRHRLDGCLYAVKRINRLSASTAPPSSWSCGPLREVWALAAVMAAGSVPASLCRYYGSWYEDSQLHIVTDWCEGATLRSLLDDGSCRAWGEHELVLLLRQLAQALQHLHALGLAHLDVKPDNILLCPTGSPLSSLQCRLVDFGLATPLSSHPQQLPGVGDRRYLPQYAVEHEDAAEAVQRIDCFMLGMTALEAVKGAQLTDDERARVQEGGRQGGCARTVEGSERLSEDVLAVLDGLLCADLWDRWDAEDVLRRLAEPDAAECERREASQRMQTAVAEAESWRERAQAAEKERDGCSARLSQLERYVQQVQAHMARLQQ